MPKTLQQILKDHSESVDSIVAAFTNAMSGILDASTADLISTIRSEIAVAGGLIESSTANQKFLAGLDKRFKAAMDANGFPELVDNYVQGFNGQFIWFDEVINHISASMDNPLPKITFDKADNAAFKAYKVGSQDLIESSIERAASRARQQATLAVGGLPVDELTNVLQETWDTSLSEAQNLAETSISSFYRTITDKGYQIIEDDLPGFEVRYGYDGPLDKLNRPFCLKLERLARAGKTWTREAISNMSNGQIPNVFVSCGGYRCRHQWIISLPKAAKVSGKRPASSRERVKKQVEDERTAHAGRMRRIRADTHPKDQIESIRAQSAQRVADARSVRHA